MSWLVSNWYGVLALFATPAIVGIGCWVVAHTIIGQRERHDRAREARKHADLPLARPARRG